MQIHLSDKELFILKKISISAEELHFPSFLIGGFIRDKIIGRDCKDADIVCLGNGIMLAQKTAEKFNPQPTVAFFKNFGTAHISVNNFDVEFVGARKESYNSESRKPEVQNGSLEEDQKRRDFTINAISLSLNKDDFG